MSFLRVFLTSRTSIAVLALSAIAGGCSDSVTAPSHFAPFSQQDLVAGTGTAAASGSLLTVNYTGWLYNAAKPEQKGAQFDSSLGVAPFTFTLGVNQVIAGWDRGLVGMKIGGRRRLVIPPSLGYGDARNGSIPPNATLVFDIDLIDVQ